MKGLTLAVALAACGIGAAAIAEGGHGAFGRGWQSESQPARIRAGGVSMSDAIQLVERRFNGRVKRASVAEDGGRRVYVLLVDNGREVRTVRVDASSGAIVGP